MSRRCQHNHHRPKVFKGYHGMWIALCSCGWSGRRIDWHAAVVYALAHSQELTS